MEIHLLLEESLKKQLLNFIEDLEEPFDIEFLMKSCLQPVSEIKIHDVLCELIEEGKIIRISGNQYLSTRVLMKRWLRQKIRSSNDDIAFEVLELPRSLIRQISRLIREKPELGYINVSEFIRDAIRRWISNLDR